MSGAFLNWKILKSERRVACHNPGAQDALIEAGITVSADVGELGDLTGDEPFAATRFLGGQINLDAHVLAEQGFGRDAGGVAEQPHPELEQPGYLLGALHRAKFQLLAQRAVGNKVRFPIVNTLYFIDFDLF